MKLDVSALRYLSNDDFRALTGVEIGQKNHEIVPVTLIASIAGLRHGGVEKLLSNLCRHKLLHHESKPYHGYRLTNLGYDYLALRTFLSRSVVSGVGRQIGVGKESDIFTVSDEGGEEFCLKLHRLGRTSFRAIKTKRDYHKGRKSPSWLYLSRLAATKEYQFLKVLRDSGFPVPRPVDHNRHCLVMSLVDGFPLNQVKEVEEIEREKLYRKCVELVVRFARYGLIHGDFNEFNLMVNEQGELTVIDFPQMVSIAHPNARMYFERDMNCVSRFFRKRFGFVANYRPTFDQAVEKREAFLDREVMASGFTKAMAKELDAFLLTDPQQQSDSDDDSEEGEAQRTSQQGEIQGEIQGEKSVAATNDRDFNLESDCVQKKTDEKNDESHGENNVDSVNSDDEDGVGSGATGMGASVAVNDGPEAYLAFDYVTENRSARMNMRSEEDIRRRVRREAGKRGKGKQRSMVKQSRNVVKNRDKRALKQVIKER